MKIKGRAIFATKMKENESLTSKLSPFCICALFHRVIVIWTKIRIEWEQTKKKQQLKNCRKRTTRENKTYWLQILLQAQMKRKTLRAYKWNSGYYVLLNCCLFSMAFRFLFARGRYINNSWRLELVWCVCVCVWDGTCYMYSWLVHTIYIYWCSAISSLRSPQSMP